MRRKRIFTTTLILLTLLVAVFLTMANIFTNTIEITEDNNQEVNVPIYNFGNEYIIDWPEISTDALSRCIVSCDGQVDIEKFKKIFESEFEKQENAFDIYLYTFEYEINNDIINVNVDSNMRMYESELILNPTKTYSYHLKNNDYSYNI